MSYGTSDRGGSLVVNGCPVEATNSCLQAIFQKDKGTSAPDHVTSSCLRPEERVKRAHCSAVILYMFFAILAKSQFVISINNSTKTEFIYLQFHWAVCQGILYLEIMFFLTSYICVL